MSNSLSAPIQTLRNALTVLTSAYTPPIAPLLPRAGLFLFNSIASSLYLLEHALWAVSTGEVSAPTDVEVFTRWVDEGGLKESVSDVTRVMAETKAGRGSNREELDRKIVFGEEGTPKEIRVGSRKGDQSVAAHL